MWFSYELGPVHWLYFSTETDYNGAPSGTTDNRNSNTSQLDWMARDLASVDRRVTPFVIAVAHRPLLANGEVDDNGQPKGQAKIVHDVFLPLLARYHVDLYITGHVHDYQRTTPLANGTLTQILAGAGGSIEGISKEPKRSFPWLASEYGASTSYGILGINRTHLMWENFATTTGNPLVDSVVIRSKF